jgi:amidophosphoribosyltransferase
MSELNHECGIAAVYHLPVAEEETSLLCPGPGQKAASRLIPRMLLDIQNRGQLAAGMTVFDPGKPQILRTYKDVGSVTEVFRLSHQGKAESVMRDYAGRAAIGHVRYATCGQDDKSYAQPFERPHLEKRKWFAFGFNGQLANYSELRDQILKEGDLHLGRETDTEIVMHELAREWAGENRPDLMDVMAKVSQRFDGAYSLVLMNALGEMLVARDPLGIKPLCYAKEGPMFAAASESVALLNLGFDPQNIHSLLPGQAIVVSPDRFEVRQFTQATGRAHCFFEWIYFANVASTLDEQSVYQSRAALGTELARIEKERGEIPLDRDTIVVPVPDTSKAAADAMAFELGVPAREGLIRNRYTGRTFIEGHGRRSKAETKYTPLREVMEGKRVILVEDSIVRSTTMKVLLGRLKEMGGAKEVHVRVACPPIVAPCFYGIDMSTIGELFAPKFQKGKSLTEEEQEEMAKTLGCDSLRYLPIESIARAVGFDRDQLCQGCITGEYPTPHGERLYNIALQNHKSGNQDRTYESESAAMARS